MALLAYRILERKRKETENFTTAQILNTLRNIQVITKDGYHESAYMGLKVLDSLESSFGLGIDKRYYRKKKLEKILKTNNAACYAVFRAPTAKAIVIIKTNLKRTRDNQYGKERHA